MKYRYFKHNEQVTDWVFSTEGEFSTPVGSHVADLATALGVPENEIAALESEIDPSPLIVAVVPPAQSTPDPIATAAAKVESAQRDDAALRLFMRGEINKAEMEAVTGKPYSYGVNYPAPF